MLNPDKVYVCCENVCLIVHIEFFENVLNSKLPNLEFLSNLLSWNVNRFFLIYVVI